MSYAPPYSPATSFAQDESNQAAGRATVRTASLDVETANLAATVNALNANLQKLQRDDDKLRDLLVEPYALSEQTRAIMAAAGKTPRGSWTVNTLYVVGDLVQYQAIAYMCRTAHDSGPSFNVGFWLAISGDGSSASSAQQSAASAATASAAATSAAASAVSADTFADAALLSANEAADSQLAAQNAANSIAGLAPVNLSVYMLDFLANNNAAGARADIGAASSAAMPCVEDAVFGGTVGDGLTSDQTAIEAAVAFCLANSLPLYWPGKAYLSTASIANFHAVRHVGTGRIVRGTDTFYISPTTTQTNRLYVKVTTGSNTSDGLSASQPRQTLQSGIDILSNWTSALLAGTWRIVLAAGTYARGRFPDAGLRSANPIYIEGPAVGHPNVPTALVKEGATEAATGIFCANTDVYLKDIKIEDYNGTVSSGGVTGNGRSIYGENLHISDCYFGVSNSRGGSVINLKGGIIDDCGLLNSTTLVGAGGAAIRGLFHVKFEVGNQGATDLTEGPFVTNCVTGIFAQEGCKGHADWVSFADCSTGVVVTVQTRLNLGGSDFKRCNVATQATLGSLADVASNTTYGTGADANGRRGLVGINSNANGAQVIDTVNHMLGNTEYRFKASYPNTVISSTSSGNAIEQLTIKGGIFTGPAYSAYPAAKIRIRVRGVLAGTAGAKTISVRVANAGVTAAAVFGATSVGPFDVNLDADFVQTAVQLLSASGSCTAQSTAIGVTQATNDMTVDQPIFAHAFVANAADSITIRSIEWYIAGV